jgi:hypothetical protein
MPTERQEQSGGQVVATAEDDGGVVGDKFNQRGVRVSDRGLVDDEDADVLAGDGGGGP